MSQNLENQLENQQEIKKITQKVIGILKTILDPEVGINIWDFGLIYGVNIKQIGKKQVTKTDLETDLESNNSQNLNLESNLGKKENWQNQEKQNHKLDLGKNSELESKLDCFESFVCEIVMTFTSVNCPAIDLLPREIKTKISQILQIETKIEIVWSPKWEISLLSEEIQFELGIL